MIIKINSVAELNTLEGILFTAEWEHDPHIDFYIECDGYCYHYVTRYEFGRYFLVTA